MALTNNFSINTGNITKNVNIRQNRNGSYSAFFVVACNDYGAKQQNGRRKQYANFIPFRNYLTTQAQVNFYRKLTKGKKVTVAGSIRSNNYTDKNGQRQYRFYVKPYYQGISFVNPNPQRQQNAPMGNNQPMNNGQPNYNPAMNNGQPMNNQPVNNNQPMNNNRPVNNNRPMNNQPVNNQTANNSQPMNNQTANNSQPMNNQPVNNNQPANNQPVNNQPANNQPANNGNQNAGNNGQNKLNIGDSDLPF